MAMRHSYDEQHAQDCRTVAWMALQAEIWELHLISVKMLKQSLASQIAAR